MKILFINTGPWGTGSFTIIQSLTKELIKLGHEVIIFFPDANFQSTDKEEYYNNPKLYHIWKFPLQKNNIVIPTFPLMITDPHPRNPNGITFKQLTDDQLFIYEESLRENLQELIASFKPDIIECHHIWYASWIVQQMGLKYFVTAHHSDQLGFHYDHRIKEKAIAAASGAKKIFAISDSVKREVIRLYKVPEDKVEVIANGYDNDVFRKRNCDREAILKKLKLSIPSNAPIVSFAGKLSRTKGIDTILQANKIMNQELDVHIIALGSGDIETICKRLDPNSYNLRNIHFLGHQTPNTVAEIHNISQLSIMPSRSEGFGLSCLEAMGCGLPMVVSRCGGPENYAVGKIIDVGSAEQLAEGILEILNLPPPEYQMLSRKAIEIAEKYSMSGIVKLHLEMYDELLV